MSVCLALGKGRCKDPHVLQFCRRSCALQIATASRVTARWFPSEWNPTDHASRLLEPGKPGASHVPQALPRLRGFEGSNRGLAKDPNGALGSETGRGELGSE